MANLPESPTWEDVYQLEVTDQVLAGPTGPTNIPLKNLTNRTKYLKDYAESIGSDVGTLLSQNLDGRISTIEGADLENRVIILEDHANIAEATFGGTTGHKHCVVTGKRTLGTLSNEHGATFLNSSVLTGASKKVVISASADEPLVISVSGGYRSTGPVNYYYYQQANIEIPFSTNVVFLLVLEWNEGTESWDWLMEPFYTPIISYSEPTTASNGTYWYDLKRERQFKREAGAWVAYNRLVVGKINDPDDIVEYYPWFGKSMMQLYGRGHVPAGTVHTYAGDILTIPDGYLLCNGGAISRALYSDLYYAIRTTYGVGDGSTTFNLPDLRGEFIRGLDNGRGIDAARALGSAQADMLKSHFHIMKKYNRAIGTGAGFFAMDDQGTDGSENTESTGGTETRPRNIAMNYIIKF